MTLKKVAVQDVLKDKVLVMDGAMGTMIQKYTLDEKDYRGERFKDFHLDIKGNNELLSLTRPEIISAIHEEYLATGCDIIETNTFSANKVSQADYEMEEPSYEMNLQSAKIAVAVANKYSTTDHPRYVAGAMGPTTRTASLSPDVNDPGYRAISFDDLVEAYLEQARGLVEGGVDILLIETVFDTLNCKAALYALDLLFEEINRQLPIMVSGTITDASGRTLSGRSVRSTFFRWRQL